MLEGQPWLMFSCCQVTGFYALKTNPVATRSRLAHLLPRPFFIFRYNQHQVTKKESRGEATLNNEQCYRVIFDEYFLIRKVIDFKYSNQVMWLLFHIQQVSVSQPLIFFVYHQWGMIIKN